MLHLRDGRLLACQAAQHTLAAHIPHDTLNEHTHDNGCVSKRSNQREIAARSALTECGESLAHLIVVVITARDQESIATAVGGLLCEDGCSSQGGSETMAAEL